MSKWTSKDIPSQRGRVAIVTGTGGLGLETALALARAGASVVIAGRNPAKGAKAVAAISDGVPNADIRFGLIDLASLESVACFAADIADTCDAVDLLVNNAGVMTPPQHRETQDGFELQFGTNYLGHFALTGHLLPLLKNGREPRVVTLGSVAARSGAIDFDNLQAEKGYRAFRAYGQSKLACIMFAFELNRRCRAAGLEIQSLAAHPGISRTDLIPNGSGASSVAGRIRQYLWFLYQPVWQGALPTLFAATDPEARPGAYYGPDGLAGIRGYPVEERAPTRALDADVAARLWRRSEMLTGIHFFQPQELRGDIGAHGGLDHGLGHAAGLAY